MNPREIERLHRQVATLKSGMKSLQARHLAVQEDLAQADATIELFTATRGSTKPCLRPRRGHCRRGSRATAIAVVTDWHAEETVDPATVAGENEFNLQVARRRVRQLWEKIVHLTEGERHLSNIDELVVACLGDLIGGHIHDELAESNSLSPVQAIRWVQQELASGLAYLQEHGGFKRIRVVCCSGNHGRDTKKTRIATREAHSYEWLAYHNVASLFAKERRLQFDIAQGAMLYTDVDGHLIRFTHGDAIKYGGGIGGLTIPATKKVMRWNEVRSAYLTFFGHFHQYLQGNKFVCCPTLKGYDAFSQWIGAPKEPPSQLFSVIDNRRGLTVAKPIFVE